jgi:hypothetical protein
MDERLKFIARVLIGAPVPAPPQQSVPCRLVTIDAGAAPT